MQVVYVVYAILAIMGVIMNTVVFILRKRQHSSSTLPGISEEHGLCLQISDILLVLTSLTALVSSFQDMFPANTLLCDFAGFTTLYIVLANSWTPLMTSIILLEKERHCLRIKSYQGMTSRIVFFIIAAMLVIAAGLVSINYAPITEFDSERHLLCLPVTFPYQLGFEYTKLLMVIIWCGVVSTWSCILVWLVYLRKNRMSVRYVTESHRSTKSAGLQAVTGLLLWTIVIVVLSIYYWKPFEDLLHTAIFFSFLFVIGHPAFSFVIHWLGGPHRETDSILSRDMPSRLTDISPLTVNPDKNVMKFHGRWMGMFGEKIEAIIKVYTADQKNRWLREARAMSILRKTEHPNIAKYLWVSRGQSVKFPTARLTQDYVDMLMNTNNRLVSMQYYEHRSLRDLLLHKPSLVTDISLKYIALDVISALVLLRQLHIVHNKINSKTVFIKCTPKNKMLTAVVGNFEESEQVMVDHYRHQKSVHNQHHQQATAQLDDKFAADIRSYALLLLELVSAWNKYNGQPLKVSRKSKPKKDTESLHTGRSQPETMNQNRQRKGRQQRAKSRSLSQKPQFSEIEEEQQSNLQNLRVVNGEEIAIEVDEFEDEIPEPKRDSYITGVIIPPGMTEKTFNYNRIAYHPVIGRQSSTSACSNDSGYPKSILSGSISHISGNLPSPTASTDQTPSIQEYIAASINKPHQNGNMSPGVHLSNRTVTSLNSSDQSYQPDLRLSPGALQNFMKAKQTLPKDILADCEEYELDDDPGFSEEEKIYEIISTTEHGEIENGPRQLTKKPDLNLTELAEQITQDLDDFLKSKSMNNSICSSPASRNITPRTQPSDATSHPSDATSQTSDYSNVTFSSTAENPLHLKLDKELYIDRIISERHKSYPDSNQTGRFIYRSGISKAQLYYSKELSSMYEIITPQLLYMNEKTTKKLIQQYSSKLKVPTVKQLLGICEPCWLQDPVQPADVVLSQLRKEFSMMT